MRGTTVLVAASLVVGGVLLVRGLERAVEPPFEVGLPEGSPLRAEVRGLATRVPCGNGHLDIRASLAQAGHEALGPYRLGPPTFVALSEVEAEYWEDGARAWVVRGRQGRWDERGLRLEGDACVEGIAGVPSPCGEVSVDLRSGRLHHR